MKYHRVSIGAFDADTGRRLFVGDTFQMVELYVVNYIMVDERSVAVSGVWEARVQWSGQNGRSWTNRATGPNVAKVLSDAERRFKDADILFGRVNLPAHKLFDAVCQVFSTVSYGENV